MEKNQKIFLVAVAIVVLILIIFGFPAASSKTIDDTTYQAVFLTNGQVYFGKLSHPRTKYPELQDVYYLRRNPQQPEKGETIDQPQITLIKLGNEIHGPVDQMFVNRDHILFWENLKKDSEVVASIMKQKAQEAAP